MSAGEIAPFSILWLIAFLLFIGGLVLFHIVAARKKPAFIRLRYFVVLVVVLVATAFIPILHDPSKFGWVPVGLVYALLPSSVLRSEDDLGRLFLICYAIAAAHHVLAVAVAFTLTRKRPNKSPEPTPTAVTPRATDPKLK